MSTLSHRIRRTVEMKEKGEKSIFRQNSAEQSGAAGSRSQARFYGSSFLRQRKAYLLLYRIGPFNCRSQEEQEVQFPRPGLEQIARPKPGFGERYVFPGFRLRIMAMTKVRILHGSIRGIELHLVGRVRPPCVVGSCNRGLEGETYLKDSHYS